MSLQVTQVALSKFTVFYKAHHASTVIRRLSSRSTLGLLGWLLISRMVPILHIILLLLIELTAALSTLKPSPFPSMHYSCRHTQRSTAPDDCLYIINALPRDTIASLDTVVRWSYDPLPLSHHVPRYYKKGECDLQIYFVDEDLGTGISHAGPIVLRARLMLEFLAEKWCRKQGAVLEYGKLRFVLGSPSKEPPRMLLAKNRTASAQSRSKP